MSDSKLANAIKEKLSIKCVNDSGVMELMRGIRGNVEGLLTSVDEDNLRAMRLGLSHSLSRYKLKFSADKVGPAWRGSAGLVWISLGLFCFVSFSSSHVWSCFVPGVDALPCLVLSCLPAFDPFSQP